MTVYIFFQFTKLGMIVQLVIEAFYVVLAALHMVSGSLTRPFVFFLNLFVCLFDQLFEPG